MEAMDIYDILVEDSIATPSEISLVTSVTSLYEESYLDILFIRTGCRSIEEYQRD